MGHTLVSLTKWQLIIGSVISVLIPTLTSVGANYTANASAHQVLGQQINDVRVESYQKFAAKEDIKELRAKLEDMDGKLNRIEGYLQKR